MSLKNLSPSVGSYIKTQNLQQGKEDVQAGNTPNASIPQALSEVGNPAAPATGGLSGSAHAFSQTSAGKISSDGAGNQADGSSPEKRALVSLKQVPGMGGTESGNAAGNGASGGAGAGKEGPLEALLTRIEEFLGISDDEGALEQVLNKLGLGDLMDSSLGNSTGSGKAGFGQPDLSAPKEGVVDKLVGKLNSLLDDLKGRR